MGTLYGFFRSLLEEILGLVGLGLVRKPDLLRLKAMDAAYESNFVDFEIISKLSGSARENYAKSKPISKSALRQDLFALLVSGFKQKGFLLSLAPVMDYL